VRRNDEVEAQRSRWTFYETIKGLPLSGDSLACFRGLTKKSESPLLKLGRRSWENNNGDLKKPDP
jgi:hypothetical protein